MLELRPEGLYCPAGDFHIDPSRGVDRAVITHGHSDHARWGSKAYLCSEPSEPILRARLGEDVSVQTLAWGEPIDLNGVRVSLHPAGHIVGSAMVRIEHRGEVWLVTGDYKTEADSTSGAWEPVACHTMITETTFGLPIYRWRPQAEVFGEINEWWAANRSEGRASVLSGYSLGKAQRMLAGVDPSIGPILVHGAVQAMNRACSEAGLVLPPTLSVGDATADDLRRCLVIAPPSALESPWIRRFGEASVAFASGWMAVRGRRRQRNLERGFVLSDHVDWPSLLGAVRACGAERVLTTHGFAEESARWMREAMGLDARPLHDRSGRREEAEDA
ncbi:MAG: ligase-associated DNA damage response exonuclease [Fimbriimonadaceae bacterium]|nr:ligase-associated DNA damage response exonuclease [Fimbriimonadaceae bacterium]